MLIHSRTWVALSSPTMLGLFSRHTNLPTSITPTSSSELEALKLCRVGALSILCSARRRVRYEEDEDDEEEEYGHNEEIAMLEFYSQSARGEALIVKALVDDREVEVLIFKGFSSSLSYGTSADPSKSILPARAVIKSIDRVKGPFDPSNIEYLQKGLTWEAFKKSYLTTF
ncbi:hypothetical protein UlMin_040656 [Ulmus minor]